MIYGTDIQKELIQWIRNELESGRLFEYTNWKPFRDQEMLVIMYMGYRKMFKYKQYYFQLSLDDWCGDCSYCKKDNIITAIHFQLELYGWIDKENVIQPTYYHNTVLPDETMSEKFWNIK